MDLGNEGNEERRMVALQWGQGWGAGFQAEVCCKFHMGQKFSEAFLVIISPRK